MYIAKKYFETNKGSFKKGDVVPNELAEKYLRDVELVGSVKEELLVETPSKVDVIVEESDGKTAEEAIDEMIQDLGKNKKNKR